LTLKQKFPLFSMKAVSHPWSECCLPSAFEERFGQADLRSQVL